MFEITSHNSYSSLGSFIDILAIALISIRHEYIAKHQTSPKRKNFLYTFSRSTNMVL